MADVQRLSQTTASRDEESCLLEQGSAELLVEVQAPAQRPRWVPTVALAALLCVAAAVLVFQHGGVASESSAIEASIVGLDASETDCKWQHQSLGHNTVCRANAADRTFDGNGTAEIIANIGSVDACKALCAKKPDGSCTGIEFTLGRCELWTVPIQMARPCESLQGKNGHWNCSTSGKTFECHSYSCETCTWTFRSLGPDAVCRVSAADQSLDGHGTAQIVHGVQHFDDCKAHCSAKPAGGCTGVEFAPGQCKLWTVPIGMTRGHSGSQCWTHLCEDDGAVFGTGQSSDGALSLSDTSNFIWTEPQPIIKDVRQALSGDDWSLMVFQDNTIGLWGHNYMSTPRFKSFGLEYVKEATAGEHFFFLQLWNGSVLCAGENKDGQCGIGTTTPNYVTTPTTVIGAEDLDIKTIVAGTGNDHAFIILRNGSVFGLGENKKGQLGLGDTNNRDTLARLPVEDVQAGAGGQDSSFLVLDNGEVMAAGNNNHGQLGVAPSSTVGGQSSTWTKMDVPFAAKVTAGDDFVLILMHDGSVYGSGKNTRGQLGLGDVGDKHTPTKNPFLADVRSICAGNNFAVAILADGKPYSFGGNNFGELGVGTESHEFCDQEESGYYYAGYTDGAVMRCLRPTAVTMPSGVSQFKSVDIGPDSEHALYMASTWPDGHISPTAAP